MPIADYKQFLNLRSNRPFHLGYYPPHAAGVTPYAEPTVGLPNPHNLMCGWCDAPYLQHPVTDPFGTVLCKRPLSDFHVDNDYDYYADTYLTVKDAQPAPSYEQDSDADSGIDYDYALDSWHDTHPEEFTSATHWWSSNPPRAYAQGSRQAVGNLPTTSGESTKGRPVRIDGIDGFTSVQVFDPDLTERLALRSYLNYYVDNNTGDTRLGGLILTRNGSEFRAKCVRNDWNTNRCASKVLTIDTEIATREEMETFTLNVIRHGNNHAAPWFTKRATFYKVHTSTCDLTCSPESATCTPAPLSLQDQITMLAHSINSRKVA